MTEIEDEVEEKTEFKFSELSDDAKEKARNTYRYRDGYPYDEWWDAVYEDAVRMGSLIGIEIGSTKQRTAKGRCYESTDIWFSGFCSQGDGASFTGQYEFKADAVKQVTEETNDKELIRIATELTLLQVTRRVLGLQPFSATVEASGRYSHSGGMSAAVSADDDDGQAEDGSGVQDIEDEVTQLMRGFADWIYKNLEQENDYLMSDEVVDEALAEDLFDADGCMI